MLAEVVLKLWWAEDINSLDSGQGLLSSKKADNDSYCECQMANQDSAGPLRKGLQIKHYVSLDTKSWYQTPLLRPQHGLIALHYDVTQSEQKVPVPPVPEGYCTVLEVGNYHTWNTSGGTRERCHLPVSDISTLTVTVSTVLSFWLTL